jgi:DNA helicase INO80
MVMYGDLQRRAASNPKARAPQKAKEEANGEDTPQRTKRVKRQTKLRHHNR